MDEIKTSKGARTNADVTALLKARNTLLWIVTKEEERVERALVDAAAAAKLGIVFWDCADGMRTATRELVEEVLVPMQALDYVEKTRKSVVYVMRDLPNVLDQFSWRKLRSVVRFLKSVPTAEARCIIVLSPSNQIPAELQGHVVLVEYPLPDRTEVAAILDSAIESIPERFRAGACPNGTRDAAIDAAMGLCHEEIESCFARSLVTSIPPRIDPALVGAEKKRVIGRQGLQVHDPDPRGLDAIGGLDLLKLWVTQRKVAFTPAAKAYGLPAPKGCLLVGPPGTGKSLAAKCFATAFGLPLFRLDLGAQKSKYVGESEQNIRRILAVAEAAAPCVLWVDEIDKALKGASGDQGDGGVAADQLGAVLTFLQETKAPVFAVATANDVTGLPPELLRKGRFDEVFFVDLPNEGERAEILRVSLKAHGVELSPEAIEGVVAECDGYTGSEINALVPDAMFVAFADNARPVETRDLVKATVGVVPLSKLASEKIKALRDWAETRARRASSRPKANSAGKGRVLDLT
jgi:hypothetical protein